MSLIGKMREKWKLRQERKGVGRRDPQAPSIRIETPWGPVTESARRQAAANMQADPVKKAQVERLLADQLFGGDLEKGREESEKRYPEAYVNLD